MQRQENERGSTKLKYLELFGEARKLIGSEYWLFVGIVAVGHLIAGFVPFYICYGPMTCGIFHVFRQKQARRDFEFVDLFRGFDRFLPSLVVSLVKLGLSLALVLLWIPLLVFAVLGLEEANLPSNEATVLAFATMVAVYVVLIVGLLVIEALFLYAFPLLIDRDMSAGEAMKAGLRACAGNLWGTVVLVGLNGLLMMVGASCCFLPFFLVLPFAYGVTWLAYRRIFGAPPVDAAEGTDPLLSAP